MFALTLRAVLVLQHAKAGAAAYAASSSLETYLDDVSIVGFLAAGAATFRPRRLLNAAN